MTPTNRAQTLDRLSGVKTMLRERYAVAGPALFGSMARDAARTDSDVDILVGFDGPPRPNATSAFSSCSRIFSGARSVS